MPMQIRRTPTPNNAPAGLAEGQLAVEMATEPPRLWVGVPTSINAAGRILLAPGGATVGNTPPSNPALGDLWWDDVGAQLFVFDAANQWVVAVNQPAGGGGLDETAVSDLIAAALVSYTPPLPSPTTGTGSWVRFDSPSLRQPLITGRTDGTGAGIGNVGQVLVASSNNFNFSMTSNVKTTAVTLTLAAGTYLVSGSISLIAGTAITQAITELSALQSVGGVAGNALIEWYGNSLTVIHNLGPAQIGFNSTNNVNLTVQATYTGGMQEGRATLVAQRIV